jgi:hypothetical protein
MNAICVFVNWAAKKSSTAFHFHGPTALAEAKKLAANHGLGHYEPDDGWAAITEGDEEALEAWADGRIEPVTEVTEALADGPADSRIGGL